MTRRAHRPAYQHYYYSCITSPSRPFNLAIKSINTGISGSTHYTCSNTRQSFQMPASVLMAAFDVLSFIYNMHDYYTYMYRCCDLENFCCLLRKCVIYTLLLMSLRTIVAMGIGAKQWHLNFTPVPLSNKVRINISSCRWFKVLNVVHAPLILGCFAQHPSYINHPVEQFPFEILWKYHVVYTFVWKNIYSK